MRLATQAAQAGGTTRGVRPVGCSAAQRAPHFGHGEKIRNKAMTHASVKEKPVKKITGLRNRTSS